MATKTELQQDIAVLSDHVAKLQSELDAERREHGKTGIDKAQAIQDLNKTLRERDEAKSRAETYSKIIKSLTVANTLLMAPETMK